MLKSILLSKNIRRIYLRMLGLLYAKGIILISTVYVARKVGPENYGHIRLALTLFSLLGILSGFPMERVVAFLIAKESDNRKQILYHSIIFLFVIIFFSLILFFLMLKAFNIVNDDIAVQLFFKYSPFVYFYVFTYVFIAFLQGSSKIFAMTISEVIYGTIKALSIITFVYLLGFNGWVAGRISGEVVSFILILFIIFLYSKKLLNNQGYNFDLKLIKILWKKYLYRVSETGLAALQENLDAFMVIWLVNDVKQIAYIGAAKIFLTSFGLFGKSITSGLFPSIAILYDKKNDFLRHLKSTQFATNAIFLILLTPIFIFSEQIVVLIYKNEFLQAAQYLRFFIVAAVFQNISFINGGYWLAVGNVKLSTKFSVISSVAYILLSVILMHFYDVFGIILAIMISKIVNALVSIRFNRECIV